jgi:hypothetical protein
MASTGIITSTFIMLARKFRSVGHIIREVTEIELHPGNMNREGCLSLSKSWK